jgi:predicted NBD/HSP70 family sugar kinase
MGRSSASRGTNLPAVGEFNQNVIINVIRQTARGISRAEIARLTGLSPQTVSNVTARLITGGLVEEVGTFVHGRGKPRRILRLRSQARFAIGVHFDPARTASFVLDLAGGIVAHRSARTKRLTPPSALIADLAADVAEVLAAADVDRSAVLGVGLATPGPIDLVSGTILGHDALPGWDRVPIRDELAEATGFTVAMAKDVTAVTVAELWVGTQARDFAFVYYSAGLGTGLVLGGQPYEGRSGNAGEGGTLVVPSAGLPDGRISEQLGHLVTPRHLVEQAVAEGLALPDGPDEARFGALIAAFRTGDPAAVRVLDRAGRILGQALVTLTNLLDLDEIVFGGPLWGPVADIFLPRIEATMAASDQRVVHGDPPALRQAAVPVDVAAFGAACLVLESALTIDPAKLLLA